MGDSAIAAYNEMLRLKQLMDEDDEETLDLLEKLQADKKKADIERD